MEKNIVRYLPVVIFILSVNGVCAQDASHNETELRQRAEAWVAEEAKKVKADSDGKIIDIKAAQETKRQLLKQQTTKTSEGIIAKIELYDKPFMGRIGNLHIKGCLVELFDDTTLIGYASWKDVKAGENVKIEHYASGAFDRASIITLAKPR